MADTKLSGFPLVAAALGGLVIPVYDGTTVNKGMTVDQAAKYFGIKDLGETTLAAAAARTNDIIWTGNYKVLIYTYLITGYAGSAIGRLLQGAGAAINEAATDCSCELIEGVTRTTTCINVCGWPTAVTLNTNRRWGQFFVNNVAGASVREGIGRGMHGGSAAAVASGMSMSGFKASTAAQIDRARLTSFAAITANGVGANFNAGTYLKVQGIPG